VVILGGYMKTIMVILIVLSSSMVGFSQRVDGTYERKNNTGDITFKTVKKGVNFEIVVSGTRPGTCMGQAKGKIEWVTKRVAIIALEKYDDDLTYVLDLVLVFNPNSVKIRELYQFGFHGVACNFEGLYKLRLKRNKKK